MTAAPSPFTSPTSAPHPTPRPGILDITPYTPGKASAEGVANPVKLSANENILGCSPAAREAFVAAAGSLGVYPDGRGNALRDALAERYRLEPERLILGCGTDEIFALLNQTFLRAGDNIIQGEYGFGAYAIGARANEGEVRLAAEPGYRIDVDAVLGQVDERTRLVFVANPANPTGACTRASPPRCCWSSTAPMRSSTAIPPSATGST
jgi:histidinol-phosphate aminotransferase